MRVPAFFLIFFLLSSAFLMGCREEPLRIDAAAASNSASLDHAININTASLDELTRIPHVGEKVAARIIEYREVNGPFRRVEHLMLIQGISDARFRKIRPLVRVE